MEKKYWNYFLIVLHKSDKEWENARIRYAMYLLCYLVYYCKLVGPWTSVWPSSNLDVTWSQSECTLTLLWPGRLHILSCIVINARTAMTSSKEILIMHALASCADLGGRGQLGPDPSPCKIQNSLNYIIKLRKICLWQLLLPGYLK